MSCEPWARTEYRLTPSKVPAAVCMHRCRAQSLPPCAGHILVSKASLNPSHPPAKKTTLSPVEAKRVLPEPKHGRHHRFLSPP